MSVDTRPHVLVVDDDEDLRDGIADLLMDAGYRVSTASNGAEALERMRTGTLPDVVLLDLMMPDTDGFAFRRAQRADPRLADVPVVAMTASGRATTTVDELHALATLHKPFEVNVLFELVDRAVALRPRQTSNSST